jgi:hypothetical protein
MLTETQIEIERRGRAFVEAMAADGIKVAVCIVAIGEDGDGDRAAMAFCPPFNASNVEALGIALQMREQAQIIADQAMRQEIEAGAPNV